MIYLTVGSTVASTDDFTFGSTVASVDDLTAGSTVASTDYVFNSWFNSCVSCVG
jgi:hypothetical protein